MIITIIFLVLVGGGFLVGKIVGNALFPKNDNDCTSGIDKPNIFNNYITENHFAHL